MPSPTPRVGQAGVRMGRCREARPQHASEAREAVCLGRRNEWPLPVSAGRWNHAGRAVEQRDAADKRRMVAPFGRIFLRRRLQLISVFSVLSRMSVPSLLGRPVAGPSQLCGPLHLPLGYSAW
jgi:hypothetical protein